MAVKNLMLAAALSAAAMAAPALEGRQSCQSVWSQCGGNNWSGATCCQEGSTCVVNNEWYSQCLPNNQVPTSSSPSTSNPPTSNPPASTVVPSTSVPPTTSDSPTTTAPPVGTGTVTYEGNPFTGVQMWANDYYASEVSNLAVPQLSGAMATAAAKVADVPSFMWMDTRSKISRVRDTLADIREANNAGPSTPYAGIFVVYDLPDRDCAAAASNGEYAIADGGVAKYKAYIDEIREMLISYSDTRIILVIEPDSLANMVTNLNVPKCANAQSAYEECTIYALQKLNLPNVAMYMDAGHAGWLGWQPNLQPAANLYARIYSEAGSPSALRGLATNVANYNGWNITSPPPYTQGNAVYNEKLYVDALGPLLSARGFDARFIVDQGRSGKQPTGQQEWGHWCNAIGTGFGLRPTSNTNHNLVDAFVWIKPGGECDGTSDTSADRYDHHCGLSDSLKPAPEAGEWFQAYFEQLLSNANPSFL